MTEWLKVPVLKTGVGIPYRGFESHSLRHLMLTRTLGSNSAAEGSSVAGVGRWEWRLWRDRQANASGRA